MINKEAITLLKKALKKGKDNLPNTWEIDQALKALLKEQPPASDFTKEIRRVIETFKPTDWNTAKIAYLGVKLEEACKIIDASEASRKELVKTLTYIREKSITLFEAKDIAIAAIEKAEK